MTSIKNLLDDLLNHQDESVPDVMDKHLSSDYRQRTDGTWDDRDGVGRHFEHLRTLVQHAEISVLDEITDGRTYADRHIVHITKRDGSRVTQEVYLFGDLDREGRFTRVEETTLMLSGSEADRGIGSAR